MKIRKVLLFFVVAIICLAAFAGVKPMQVFAQSGFPLPNFELPYYANMGPTWTGGPHQWDVGPETKWMTLNSGSGLDFAYGGQTFAISAMAEGNVVFAGSANNGLGTQVALQHTVGGSIIIYGHLSSIWAPLKNAYDQGQTYHVLPGYTIGQAGMTGNAHNRIHLHIEFRDGTDTCCGNSHNGGNPISWHSKVINGYKIYEYRPNELGINPDNVNQEVAYNYDGVAVKVSSLPSELGPFEYDHFAFTDYLGEDANHNPITAPRSYVFTWLPSDFVCSGTEDCETNSNPNVQFAGHGRLGGGGMLTSDLSVPANQPQPGSGSSPTATPAPQTGNSRVDIFENTNYGGEQYGWDDPTNGWVNGPGSLNDKVSSVQIDSGYSLWVAKDQNGGGTRKCLVSSYTDLSGAYYDDTSPMTDTISSVNVFHDSTCGGAYLGTRPGDTVTFWVDMNYSNTNWGVHDPFANDLPSYLQNVMTSIGITPGWSAVLYEGPNFTGGFTCYVQSSSDMRYNLMNNGAGVSDNPESVEVFHDTNCGGQMHAPTITTLTAEVTNTSNGEVTITYNLSGAAPGYSVRTNFGEGNDFDQQGPVLNTTATHNYFPGSYIISVTVKGTDGIPYAYLLPITVSAPPPSFSLTIDSADTASGLVNFTLDWSNAANDWHHIDFGDGVQSFDVQGASVHSSHSVVYNPGTFTMSFSVKGLDGQQYPTTQQIVMPEPNLSLTLNSVDAVTGLVNYTAVWANAAPGSWQIVDFGHDGVNVGYQGSADTKVDSHYFNPGTYTMTFTVTGRNGLTYAATQQIVVTGPPTATPAPAPTYSLIIDSVDQNSGLTTFTLDWNTAADDWHHIDFGDGQAFDVHGTSGHQQSTVIYQPGTWTMSFTVKGLNGQNYPTSQQVTVSGPPPTATPAPPTYSLTATVIDPGTNLVEANATWNGAADDWQLLDWGDGSNVGYHGSSGTSIGSQNGYQHNYAAGTWTMTFTVKGLNGQNYTVQQTVTVGS